MAMDPSQLFGSLFLRIFGCFGALSIIAKMDSTKLPALTHREASNLDNFSTRKTTYSHFDEKLQRCILNLKDGLEIR